MFGVAAAALLLLFVGMHNAWDAITYHVFVNRGGQVNVRRRSFAARPFSGNQTYNRVFCGDIR